MSKLIHQRYSLKGYQVELVLTPDGWKIRMLTEGARWVTGKTKEEAEARLLEIYGDYSEEEDLWQ